MIAIIGLFFLFEILMIITKHHSITKQQFQNNRTQTIFRLKFQDSDNYVFAHKNNARITFLCSKSSLNLSTMKMFVVDKRGVGRGEK